MGMFIQVLVTEERCRAGQPCTACVDTCPVNIFAWPEGASIAQVVPEAEDECILCDLCLEKCPTDAIMIRKLYEEGP